LSSVKDEQKLILLGKHRGVFICVEGIDGSGKTTQARRLVKALTARGHDAVYTTEPSRGIYGRIIREHLLQRSNRVPTVVEAMLFAVDRLHHLESEVKPLLKTGKVVVCDRYVYSSIAYQGAADLDAKWIEEINRHAMRPDLAVYIDVPPEVVIRRIKRKKSVMETLQNQRKVREQYLKLVERKQLVNVDGDASTAKVATTVGNVVFKFLESL
jgi:dTMP kinase